MSFTGGSAGAERVWSVRSAPVSANLRAPGIPQVLQLHQPLCALGVMGGGEKHVIMGHENCGRY
jgi:hypothetical protein